MNIVKYTHRLNKYVLTPIDSDDIDSIGLHHMKHATAGINEVTSWHMDENAWNWIGYGYWIGFDGTIYECRGMEFLNSGIKGHNSHVVSIGFQGDYSVNRMMPTEQMLAGVELIKHLKSNYKNIKTVAGHGYFSDSDCPGKYFPIVNILQRTEEIKMSFDEALKILIENGIVTNEAYRRAVCDCVMYEKEFCINMAKKIVELKK